jgi:hypothetical protein
MNMREPVKVRQAFAKQRFLTVLFALPLWASVAPTNVQVTGGTTTTQIIEYNCPSSPNLIEASEGNAIGTLSMHPLVVSSRGGISTHVPAASSTARFIRFYSANTTQSRVPTSEAMDGRIIRPPSRLTPYIPFESPAGRAQPMRNPIPARSPRRTSPRGTLTHFLPPSTIPLILACKPSRPLTLPTGIRRLSIRLRAL